MTNNEIELPCNHEQYLALHISLGFDMGDLVHHYRTQKGLTYQQWDDAITGWVIHNWDWMHANRLASKYSDYEIKMLDNDGRSLGIWSVATEWQHRFEQVTADCEIER